VISQTQSVPFPIQLPKSEHRTGIPPSFKNGVQSVLLTTLLSRINLVRDRSVGKGAPIVASLSKAGWNVDVQNIVRALHDVHIETTGYVPSNMAMEWPNSWVIRIKLDNGKSATRDELLGVAAGGVARVHNCPIPSADPRGKQRHSMAMKMHGMCSWRIIGDWVRK